MKTFIKDIFVRLMPIYQKYIVWKLRRKKKLNVVFFASSVSMWRYQHLYENISSHPKFNPYIVILPAMAYSEAQQKEDVNGLIKFFTSKNIPHILGVKRDGGYINLMKELSPDILFYPQPYNNFYISEFSYSNYYNRLLCYYPYAFWTAGGNWSYNQPLHKMAWKLFYSTDFHRKDAVKYSYRKDRNVEVVGYPSADSFITGNHNYEWKPQPYAKKRMIWAPHFTIEKDLLYQSNFLWMCDFMLEVARKYSDIIQFVFKPHPRLYTELCKHPDWGDERASRYYQEWKNMDNAQIETGEFVDLFMTSDAMIHDCASFTVEYHYSGNPVMYVAHDIEEQLENKNDFGKIAMNLHYVGKSQQDIIDFIENVVLAGEDPLKPKREQFYKDYLIPPHGKTVAENTMDVLLRELC